jgi:hypothetical protein
VAGRAGLQGWQSCTAAGLRGRQGWRGWQSVQQLAQLRLAVLRDERLLAHDLVDEHLEVALGRQRQQVHRLVAQLAPLFILEDDARRVVPQQEAAQLHLTRLVGRPATPGESWWSGAGRHGSRYGCVGPRCHARALTATPRCRGRGGGMQSLARLPQFGPQGC